MKKSSLAAAIIILFIPCTGISQEPAPYNKVMGSNNYVEFVEGNMPLVISIPHDGNLIPDDIPDRNCAMCAGHRDVFTMEIGLSVREHIYEKTGYYPYLVINHLHRRKLDPNRGIEIAALGNPIAEKAWYEFHSFIDSAIFEVENKFGKGLYIDLHGHRHNVKRVELGYLLAGEELRLDDDFLNDESFYEYSSLRHLIDNNLNSLSYVELLRGELSFGTMLENRGFKCVPSLQTPYPKTGEPIFSGGYNTKRHSSVSGNKMDGIQIEIDLELRSDPVRRPVFSKTLSEVIVEYIQTHIFKDIVE